VNTVLPLAARLSPAALALVAVIAIARAVCVLHRQHLEHRGLIESLRDAPAKDRPTIVRAYAECLAATRPRRPRRRADPPN
jgi:hypothetical protein